MQNQRIIDAPSGATARTMLAQVETRERVLYILHWIASAALSFSEVFSMSLIAGLLNQGALPRAIQVILVFAIGAGALKVFMILSEVIAYTPLNQIRGNYFLKDINAMTTMDLKYFEDPTFQDEMETATQATRTNDTGLEGIYHKFFPLGADIASWLVLAAVMATLRPWLFPLYLLPILGCLLIARAVSSIQNRRRSQRQSTHRKNSMYSWIATDFKYGKDSRLYRMRSLLMDYFGKEITKLKQIMQWHYRIDTTGYALSFLLVILLDFLSLLLLIQAREQGLSFERFVLYLTTLTTMSFVILRVSQAVSFVFTEFRDVRRYFGYVETNWSSASAENHQTLESAPTIEFEGVSFSYPGSDKLVLNDVSFTIAAGHTIALVGINGAGKTTLIKLLMGLYRPDQGRILINGTDYHRYSLSDMRRMFAVVFQEVEPLAITIAQHVSCEYEPADYPRIERALRRAGIWEKISALPRGMDSPLQKIVDPEGVILSGGENQKLMIARALYQEEAKIMVMDEPTAALDALAEADIYRNFDDLMDGLTGIFISHRLASTQFCDEIILLDQGQVRERGTHDELMQQGGIYRQMFDTQKRYYQEGAHEDF